MPSDVTQQVPAIADVWASTRGTGTMVAVIDEGVDVRGHPEFDGRTLPGYNELQESELRIWRPHGTKVAGLAVAGGVGVTGLAPEALLLPVCVPSLGVRTGDPAEADAIRWAADHGADVICCAWAPPDPTAESGRLPEHTRAALDYCLSHGRDGKGCVVVFAAGNDGVDISLNGYASHPGVIAVGACNNHGKHPLYSNWGETLWCVFPSNDPHDPVGAWLSYRTTTPPGSFELGQTFYTSEFGFTSAACAAVAGICALILSANTELTSSDVKRILRESCEKIDADGGTYDEHGHSPLYGFGRIDVARAVQIAQQEKARILSV